MTAADPFRIVVELDGDAWHAYCPALVKHGAATWGETRDEALENIQQPAVTPMHHGQAVRLTRLVRR